MPTFLRALGSLVVAAGLFIAAVAGWLLAADTHFQEVAAAYGRHPEHALFQAEYWAAAVRHYGLWSEGRSAVSAWVGSCWRLRSCCAGSRRARGEQPDGRCGVHPARDRDPSPQAPGRLKRLCIFIASPMSPEILSLPLMKAI